MNNSYLTKDQRLTPNEIQLASSRIWNGKRAKDLLNDHKDLDSKIINHLNRLVQKGNDATSLMYEKNLSLVYKILGEFGLGNNYFHGLEFEDFIQEGGLALFTSILNYKYWLGFAFSSYAYPSIRGKIINLLNKVSHNPRSREDMIRKIQIYTDDYLKENDNKPSQREIARHLKMSFENYLRMLPWLKGITESSIENNEESFVELIRHSSPSIEDQIVSGDRNKDFEQLLLKMEKKYPKHVYVIRSIYGFDGEYKDKEEVANELNISVRRVNQITQEFIERANLFHTNSIL